MYVRKDPETGKRNSERLVEAVIERGIRKSDIAAKEVWDGVEGPVPRQQESPTTVIVLTTEEIKRANSILDRMRVIDVTIDDEAVDP
jgi:hypothetical protein